MYVPSSELGPPTPSPESECVPPGTKGVRLWAFQFGRLVKKPGALSTLWGWSKFQRQLQKCDFLYLFLSFRVALLRELTSFSPYPFLEI